MKKTTALLLCITIALAARSQKDIPSFGKIEMEELLLKSCPFEPTANAMKLLDIQDTEFELMTYGARLKITRRVRIKIFNEKGFEHASIRIPHLSKRWAALLKGLNAVVFNLDASGKIISRKLTSKDFFASKAADNLGIVNFTFPDVRPGSVIEYTYTKIERNILQIDPWYIQDDIPVAYTSNIFTTPAKAEIKERPYGIDSIPQVMEYLGSYNGRKRITYFKENVPSFRPEPFMSSKKDNMIKVIYRMTDTGGQVVFGSSANYIWQSVAFQLTNSKLFKDQVLKPLPGTEKIIDSAKTLKTVVEKVSYLLGAIKRRNIQTTEQSLYAEDLGDAWTNRTGSTTEINLILLNFLEKLDIQSFPLLVSTRDNGKVKKEFPSVGQMNGLDLIVFDSTHFYVIDASQKAHSFQTPPFNILNREALLMIPNSVQWVNISDSRPLLKQSLLVFGDITASGELEGTATVHYHDYARTRKVDSVDEAEQGSYERFYDKSTAGLKVLSTKYQNDEDEREPLVQITDFILEPNQSGDYYFLHPQFFMGRTKNPFNSDNRLTDLDFGCNQQFMINAEIGLPTGIGVDHVPKNIELFTPDTLLYYKRTITYNDKSLFINENFEIRKAEFSKSAYPDIYDFFKKMSGLMVEEIVLKKKK